MQEAFVANRFQLGSIEITARARSALTSLGIQPQAYLDRYRHGDWGNLNEDQKAVNLWATSDEGNRLHQERVLGVYPLTEDLSLVITTEWNRSTTTLLLLDEFLPST